VVYEELSFARGLRRAYDPRSFDATMTCAYPFTNWVLRRTGEGGRLQRPAHIFVTQNGDWPAHRKNAEYRFFGCDALVCTNPEYFAAHRAAYRCSLIPNGVDTAKFVPGVGDRAAIGLPRDARVVLFVSALAPSKRVADGVRAAAGVPGVHVIVAGDGELREEIEQTGRGLLGERFRRVKVAHAEMPGLYRCADVVVHLSRDEPFGNVYVEALASGKPVVAHDTPSTRWILGEHATLVDTGDLEATTRAIAASLLEDSPEHAAARREEAQRRFSWPKVAEQYAQTIRAAVAARRGVRT
jgi:glycosyltransferase involved in cell wall biosynthesis